MAVIIKVKKAKSKPVMIAPTILVAANVIARRTIEVSTVPKMPVRISVRFEHTQILFPQFEKSSAFKRVIARYKIAMPSKTHKKAGVTVITAVIVKRVVTIPTIILAKIAKIPQPLLQLKLQDKLFI